MQAEVHLLHQSEFYRISDFRCACTECSTSRLEQGEHFSICFIRKGYFEQHVFRQKQAMHVGRVLVSKPGIEYHVRHVDHQPDICTSLNFRDAFYQQVKDYYSAEAGWFFRDPDRQSLLVASSPRMEFLHQHVLAAAGRQAQLELDDLVIRLLESVLEAMSQAQAIPDLPAGLMKHHLHTVERAQDFLHRHFAEDISLKALADHCCVSMFHFGRIFKSILNTTPYQYVTALRLQQAQLLLQSSNGPISDVALQSGFNSLEHFVTAFRKHAGTTPTLYRSLRAKDRLTLLPSGRVSRTW